LGYDGIEIDGKRPHGNPADVSANLCQQVRQRAQDAGIEIYAVAGNNDFSSPIPEHRESQLLYTRELIRMAARLGAGTVRLFGAWPGVTQSGNGSRYDIAQKVWESAHEDFTPAQTWNWIRNGLIECCAWAADEGVALALQNHPPVIDTCDAMLRMIREVGSPVLRACYDAPLARKQGETPATMRGTCNKLGNHQALTHFGGEYEETPDGEVLGWVRNRDGSLWREDFYREFTSGMLDIGYNGYTGYELCHPLPKVDGLTVGIDFVDRNAKLAARYMRRIIAEVAAVKLSAR
jgi:sugar phosphate isomerase/epimerase